MSEELKKRGREIALKHFTGDKYEILFYKG